MSYFIIPQSKGERGFHKEKRNNTAGGQGGKGRRTTAEDGKRQ